MNRLLLAALICGAAATVWLNRQTTLRRERHALETARAELAALQQRMVEDSAHETALQAAVERARIERDEIRDVVKRPPAIEPPSASLPGILTEGWLPAHAPYFYIAKKNLPFFKIDLFQEDKLTPEAALVFNLTDADRLAVNDAFDAFWNRIAVAESARVERFQPPRPNPGNTNQWVLARLPEMHAELEPIVEDFENVLRDILGNQRAEVFLTHVQPYFESEMHGLGSVPRSFVVNHWSGGSETLQVHYEQNGRTWIAQYNWSLPHAYDQRQFRHLFGDLAAAPSVEAGEH